MHGRGEMIKYKINENDSGIDISVSDVKDDKQRLLAAFQECQEGCCSCPTDEYRKLDSLQVAQTDEGLQLQLKSKQGEVIDRAEIEKCLAYTAGRVKKES